MKYIPQIHGVESPPKAPVILNEDLNEAPLIGALINCKRPANPRIAPGLGAGVYIDWRITVSMCLTQYIHTKTICVVGEYRFE